jgi:hypothetical protein
MRQIILIAVALFLSASAQSQTENKSIFKRFYTNQISYKSNTKELQFFTEVNPQFFTFGGFGGGFGAEYLRFQTGFIYLNTKLTPTFRDAIFSNAQNLNVPRNWATEIFVNAFIRRDRKGFYGGLLYSYDGYSVTDLPTLKKESFTKSYVVTRAGLKYFPFNEYFYIDGGYGLSFNVNGADRRILGSSMYSPKSILGLPFFAVGCRISLNKSNKK